MSQTSPLHPQAESRANLFTNLFFAWVYPLIRYGNRHPIQSHHLPPLHHYDHAQTVAPLFHQAYRHIVAADLQLPVPPCPNFLTRLATKIPPRFASTTFRALLPVSGSLFIAAAAWKPLNFAAAVSQVYAIRALVQHVTDHSNQLANASSRWQFLPVVISLPLVAVIMSISSHRTFFASTRVAMRVRAALSAELYRKSLRLSANALARVTDGEMGNLLVNDTQRIMDSYIYFHFCWIGFVEIIVVSMLLWIDLGPAALFGLAFLMLLVPAQIFFSALVARSRVRVSKEADFRVQKMNELLSGIKIIKQSAWERHFQSVIYNLRTQEVKHLRLGAVLRAVNAALFFAAPVLVALSTFAAYTIIFGNRLTPAIAFASLAYFAIISRSLTFIPLGWLAASEASVASKRLDRFFALEELSILPPSERFDIQNARKSSDVSLFPTRSNSSFDLASPAVSEPVPAALPRVLINHAQFSFAQHQSRDNDLATVLNDVSISVSDGQLLTIVGPVGSGKSSLLLGILGEILCTSGSTSTRGTIAYCAQKPWIINGSVRDNITMFGPAFDAEWYNSVIEACCLVPDIDILPAGDQTEIGERGVNLSGGQKARISLARAVYSKADIYLFDDPLSAVDSAVSAELLRGIFGPKGILASRTQIMVTHHLHVLPFATKVVILGSGTINHSGTYDELRAEGIEFSGFSGVEDDLDHERSIAAMENDEDEEDGIGRSDEERFIKLLQEAKVDVSCVGKEKALAEDEKMQNKIVAMNEIENDAESVASAEYNGELVVDEDRRVGRVTSGVYKAYCKAAGGLPMVLALVLIFGTAQGIRQVSEWWLAQWSTYRYSDNLAPMDADLLFRENRFYSLVFCGLAIGTALFTMLRAGLFAEWTLTASKRMHNDLLERVLHATPLFFDTNPVGRILNRFSKDIDQMDLLLPITFQDFIQIAFVAIGALATISVILPWFVIAVVPLVISFYFLQRTYKRSSRELKRLEGISRSPVYSQFIETMDGLATVRAYSSEKSFSSLFNDRINVNHEAFHMFMVAGRWLGVRLDLISSLVVFFTSLVVLIISPSLNPGLAGVALTQSIQMTGIFQWGVRQAAETENLFTSVERVANMATETPVEKPYKVPGKEPGPSWPKDGVIAFNNVVLKYRPELDPALVDLSFKSTKHERIGIVGRTGSGKSSLFVALFRLVELSGGSITIDGVDISEIGLHDLRSNMAIVPQDPVLFNGTIRSNLDPTEQYNDAQLWDALHRVHMSRAIESISGGTDCDGHGLDLVVHEKGSNFSAGERQLLSLARAILKGVKVVVLDEASASLDNYTDMLIQKTVREQLSDRTVLTIAHRLATVADSDRILVMDAGEAVEFDKPAVLMLNGGYFARLVEETGPIESTILKAIIVEASTGSTKEGKN